MTELRFIEREISVDEDTAKIKRILQYRVWTNQPTTSGVIGLPGGFWSEWIDVPLVKLENLK